MSRAPELSRDTMTAEQQAVHDAIAGGPRGGVRGPFNVLLHSPKLADAVQSLGSYVRFECAVPWKLREMAILVTAKHWTAQYEWFAHEKIAREAGLDEGIIEAIRTGRKPPFTEDAEEVVWRFATELYEKRRVSDEVFAAAEKLFGVSGVVDLVGLMGHYNVIAMTLNAFDVEVPDGSRPLAE
jgi:4-carboxymuconolactone decarboxylase